MSTNYMKPGEGIAKHETVESHFLLCDSYVPAVYDRTSSTVTPGHRMVELPVPTPITNRRGSSWSRQEGH